jgi:hypothetical protein
VRGPAPTTFVDRLALTFFVLATLKQVVTAYHWPPLPLISGLAALLIAYWVSRRARHQTLPIAPSRLTGDVKHGQFPKARPGVEEHVHGAKRV